MSERCLICGNEIPEGRQVCPLCERGEKMKNLYLKPCPFCGGPASLYSVEHPHEQIAYAVDCENKDCEVSACTQLHETPEEAVTVWNRRPGCRCTENIDDDKKYSGLIEEE